MKIFVIYFLILLQEKQTLCQPGNVGQGTKEVTLTDHVLCKDLEKDICKKKAIANLCPQMRLGREVTLTDNVLCKDLEKDKCKKKAIANLCPQMCLGREVTLTDNVLCKDLEKDKCKKKAIANLCPQMCLGRVTNSYIDTSLSKIMEPILKVTNNSKLCLKEAKKINQILDNIEEEIKFINTGKNKIAKKIRATSCADPKLRREQGYGLTRTQIYPYRYHSNHHSDYSVDVLCDQDRDGGGWTIIQMRRDVHPRENFNRPWHDYVEGFGLLDLEFWIGLKVIHELTSQETQELHISLEDWEGGIRWARYSTFRVGSASEGYKLTITGYTGDAKNSMALHNNRPFHTKDRDTYSCAKSNKGGWWYRTSSGCNRAHLNGLPDRANLNGLPDRATSTKFGEGINWYHWRGWKYSLRSVTMKIRPRHLHG